MRATIAALLLTLGPLVTSAHGQTAPPRFWTAPYGAASLNDWPTPSHGRLGVRVALPFLGRLTFYPGLEIEPELAFSQAFLDLRFGRRPCGSQQQHQDGPFYRGPGYPRVIATVRRTTFLR